MVCHDCRTPQVGGTWAGVPFCANCQAKWNLFGSAWVPYAQTAPQATPPAAQATTCIGCGVTLTQPWNLTALGDAVCHNCTSTMGMLPRVVFGTFDLTEAAGITYQPTAHSCTCGAHATMGKSWTYHADKCDLYDDLT